MSKKDQKTVQFGGKKIVVKKMCFEDYEDFLGVISQWSTEKDELLETADKNVGVALKQAFSAAPKKVASLITMGTDLEVEEVLKGDPIEVLDLFDVVWETNKFTEFLQRSKKVLALVGLSLMGLAAPGPGES